MSCHMMAARDVLPVSEASLSFSSPGAAVLFFLKEEKEKNGGARLLENPWDCHTSDISHWFAMTRVFVA